MIFLTGMASLLKPIIGAEMTSQENWLAAINLVLGIVVFFLLFFFVYWLVRQVITNERKHAGKHDESTHWIDDVQLGRVFADGGRPISKKQRLSETDLSKTEENERSIQ